MLIYCFQDFSLALGKTDRIPIILAIWSPVIALSFFTFIGVLQINENKRIFVFCVFNYFLIKFCLRKILNYSKT